MQSARKIGSRIGSITCLTTICATRSATVGTPKILSPPLFWGMETARTGGGKELPELIRFQILYRFPDKSASNCSIHCSSTPAAPRLDLTALYASYTKRFSILNGWFVCLSHASRSSCFQLFRSCDRLTRPLCSSPITGLRRSYESVRPSAPHRYSRRAVLAAWTSPLTSETGSCSSVQSPASASRLLYAGRHLLGHQAPSRFVPEEFLASGFDGT